MPRIIAPALVNWAPEARVIAIGTAFAAGRRRRAAAWLEKRALYARPVTITSSAVAPGA